MCEQEDRTTKVVTKMKYMHRDIKPDNFRVREDGTIVLIDFGISCEYWKNDKHIPFSDGKGLRGTPFYASINSHRGEELSRRDDIFSLFYTFLYLIEKNLPWQCYIKDQEKQDNIKVIQTQIYKAKMLLTIDPN